MSFYDRFQHFIAKLPGEARMAIENQEVLRQHYYMELAYCGARQWTATNSHHSGNLQGSNSRDSHGRHHRREPGSTLILKYPGKNSPGKPSTSAKKVDDSDDLNVVLTREELNQVDI